MENKGLFEIVRKLTKKIPFGKVCSYAQLARISGAKTPRIVGWALRNCKDINIPAHRVVKKDGSLAENYGTGGREEQKLLLLNEGIEFIEEFRVEMDKFEVDFDLLEY